ncbi:MAG: radical SAM protein [Acidobacteriota bacterium]
MGSLFYYGTLIKWRKLPHWLLKSGIKTLPVASGAYGMGCIGFPAHPVWEITLACNLKCIHCHASSGKPLPDELTTEEGLQLLEEIVSIREFRMLVLTGGEPLIRRDIFEILEYGKNLGLKFVIATNGTLITEEIAFMLKEKGATGLAISIDASNSKVHNFIRNSLDAFDLAINGIKNAKKARLAIQINFTVMEYNANQLEDTVEFVNDLGADIILIYQLVPVGRGKSVGEARLRMKENESLVNLIKEKQITSTTIIEPVAAPQYWPYILKKNGKNNLGLNLAQIFFHGCTAGRGLVYVKANGEVWPCPFVEVSAGNVRKNSFSEIWQNSEVFQNLRYRKEALKGKCSICQFIDICGGCRGRAWALKGDYLSEDSSCFIHGNGEKI